MKNQRRTSRLAGAHIKGKTMKQVDLIQRHDNRSSFLLSTDQKLSSCNTLHTYLLAIAEQKGEWKKSDEVMVK